MDDNRPNSSEPEVPPETFDTIVIGGGQAGLAMGYYLSQQNRDFIILESGSRVGDTWQRRWDSLRLFTPARVNGLPGMPFPAEDDYFPTKDEMADYLERYAREYDLPVRLDTKVDSLTERGDRYLLTAGSRRFEADSIVVATGPFVQPYVPAFASELAPSIVQLHSSDYRNPSQLPDGDVLVVGAGNSGAEIAVEVAATGRHVTLAGRDTGHIPTTRFGTLVGDIWWWFITRVLTINTVIGRKVRERFRRGGDPLLRLSPKAIVRAGVERGPRVEGLADGTPRLEDGRVLEVASIIWATGFRSDFSWIDLPTIDVSEATIPDRGVVETEPGLFFLGQPFEFSLASALVGGVGADARYIAERLEAR